MSARRLVLRPLGLPRSEVLWAVLALVLLAVASPVRAADDGPFVAAAADRSSMVLGESLRLTLTVTGAEDATADLSPIKDFQVVSEHKTATLSMIDQAVRPAVRLVYRLAPDKPGKRRIPALTVSAGGKSLRTEPIQVEVSAAPAQAETAPGAATAKDAPKNREAFLEVALSRREPYVGEQCVLTVKIFRAAPMAEASLADPDLSGFSARRIPGQKDDTAVLGGTAFTVTQLSYLLVPLKPGKIVIKGPVLHAELIRKSAQGKPRGLPGLPGGLDADLESRLYAGPDVTANVQALPHYAGSAPFSGLVGEFSLSLTTDKTDIPVGGSATVALTVEGRGAVMDAAPAEPAVSPGWRLYKDAPEVKAELGETGYAGQNILRYSLVPSRPGACAVGPASLVFFNPFSKQYVTAEAPAVTVTAKAAAPDPAGPQTPPAANASPASQAPGAPPAPDPTDATGATGATGQAASEDAPDLAWLWIAAGLATLAGLAVFARRAVTTHARRKTEAIPARDLAEVARQALAQARTESLSREAVLTLLAKALNAAVNARTGRRGGALTYDEIANLPPAVGLMRRLDATRFGGKADDIRELEREVTAIVAALLEGVGV